ncbi:interleukin-1 family member A [Cyprinodon tularosa]|uniref:interleukin-1 family member A n=1 Tax=Cyprinodon tularosa TaxID=77115 RepID=UPI0018E27E98|nr:interleukin-1 family member A [Cyprinodon tularosa]
MDMKDSLVNGGVLIVHQMYEGKHHYEVGNVVKYKKETGKKMFVRKGDTLMEINGVQLQDLEPEKLAQIIAEGNPMLTVHKPGKICESKEQLPPDEDTLQPYDKESTILSFSWEMTKQEDTEGENEGNEEEEDNEEGDNVEGDDVEGDDVDGEGNDTQDSVDACREENSKNEERDLLVIHMTKTSISVVRGRGCNPETPCEGCNGTGCTFNEIVVVAESSTVTLVPRGDINFRQEKLSDVLIKHVPTHRYLRCISSEKNVYTSPNPEKITIYYYKSNVMSRFFRGMAVVLNLTGSNCFLRCCKEGDSVRLETETCEKEKLRQISKSDECTFSFVFYMKADRTKQRTFESALYKGWFIHIANTDLVEMAETDGERGESSFLFVIQK